MSKAAFFLVVILINFVAGSCKKPKHEPEINYVQKMAGDHYWHGSITYFWYDPDTVINVSYNCPITVIDDSTISFSRASLSQMKLASYDKNTKQIIFESSRQTPTSSQFYTITYYYGTGVMSYKDRQSNYGHSSLESTESP